VLGATLLVAAIYVVTSTQVMVLGRRRELALLGGLGWRRTARLWLMMAEPVTAGLLAVAAAVGLSLTYRTGGTSVTPALVGLVAACGLLIYVIGGLVPALAASFVPPWLMLRQGETAAWGRTRRRGQGVAARVRVGAGVLALALGALLGRLRRYLLTLLAMAAGSGMVAAFLAVTLGMKGALYGTFLGEYLVVEIGPLHFLLAGVCLAVAGLTCAEVTGLNIVEHQGELGVLQACGWRPGSVVRLLTAEAALLGLLAGVAGYLAALAILGRAYADVAPVAGLALWCLPAVAVPVVVAAVAALIPALAALRRAPAELAREG